MVDSLLSICFYVFFQSSLRLCPSPSASCKVNARPLVRIINECGQSHACSAEFCIIGFIFTWQIHFSCSVTLIVMPHLGGGHCSVLSAHTRSQQMCNRILFVSTGNPTLHQLGVIKRELFTVQGAGIKDGVQFK